MLLPSTKLSPFLAKENEMDDLSIFVPITKIKPSLRLVYGVVTAEKPDVSGEVCDCASTKPFYQRWSQGFASATVSVHGRKAGPR
jgi:hypothetical protein